MHRLGSAGFGMLRAALDRGFDHPMNPLRHLGALTIFFFWIVLVSGIWLFMFFRTSVNGAYESVETLTSQWYLGGVMRSLHRYASDAAIITLVLHIFKEFSFDRYRGNRWFSWVTGVPLIWLIIPLGITGYWLVWDELAQYVAITSGEMLDKIPIFTDAMARNFLSNANLSDRFFTLMAFLHLIGLPLFLVFGIWLHVFRINGPNINPPRVLMSGALLAMLVLSLIFPAVSHQQADLSLVPERLALDWYYLLVYPLVQVWSPGWVWVLLLAISLLLVIAPWLPPARRRSVAVVDLDNCNGCRRCVDDCPFGAVDMAPRSDGKKYEAEAVVDPDLCVSCGLCVGACPTATPFRSRSALIPGIDLPDLSAAQIRENIQIASEKLDGNERVLVIGCEGSKAAKQLKAKGTEVVEIACMAHLPPSYVDFILSRNLADGVFMTGCHGGDCQYRFGAKWAGQRFARQRDPRLRKRVDTNQIGLAWQEPWTEFSSTLGALSAFRKSLSTATDESQETTIATPKLFGVLRLPVQAIAYAAFMAVAAVFSVWPPYQLLGGDEAILSLAFSHAGQRVGECRTLTQEELDQLPPNMRNPTECPRERLPIHVELAVDGEVVYQAIHNPSGIWNDGEATVYQRVTIASGARRLFVGMRDSDRSDGFDFEREIDLDVKANQNVVVQFDNLQQSFVFD